jgi:hypothetical protein
MEGMLTYSFPTRRRLKHRCHCLEILTDARSPRRIGWGESLSEGVVVNVMRRWNNTLIISEVSGREFLIDENKLAPMQN